MTLRELRLKAGISQEKLALEAGVSVETVRAVEQGKWGLRLDSAAKLARALAKYLPETPSQILGLLAEAYASPADGKEG